MSAATRDAPEPEAVAERTQPVPPVTVEQLEQVTAISDGDAVVLERIGFDTYALARSGEAVGFVEIVGRVHVVYQGPRYDHAVEIGQVLDLPSAVRLLVDAL